MNHWMITEYGVPDKPSDLALAYLKATTNPKGQRYITGWKKCRKNNLRWWNPEWVIVELRIPVTAGMRQPLNDKCRASRAEVVAIYACENHTCGPLLKRRKHAYANHDRSFKYVVGDTVKPTEKFDTDNDECRSGIHFFLTKERAAKYQF